MRGSGKIGVRGGQKDVTVQDLIRACPYQDVEKKVLHHYDDVDTEKLRKTYAELNAMTVRNTKDEEWYLSVVACRVPEDDDEDPVAVDVFDEDDRDLCFDVSAYKKGVDMLYSITMSSFEDFLQLTIEEKTRKRFTPASILAHALWELTCWSYEDKVGEWWQQDERFRELFRNVTGED